MPAVGRQGGIVGHSRPGLVIVAVGPCRTGSGEHLPPHAHEFLGLDPRHVLYRAGFIQVIYQLRGQDVAGVVTDDDRPPGRMEGSLQVSPHPVLVRHQMSAQTEIGRIHIQEHGGIVHQRGLMDIDVQPVIRLEHQRGLHGQSSLGPGLVGLQVQPLLYLLLQVGYPGCRIGELVGIVVSGDTERQMVSRQVELRQFIPQAHIVHPVLFRHLVAEAQAVVKQTEAHRHLPAAPVLFQCQGHLMKIVPDTGILAPDRSPAPVHCIPTHGHHRKPGSQVRLVPRQSQTAGGNDGQPLVGQFISHRPSGAPDIEGQFPGGRAHLLRSRLRRQDGRQEEKGSGCYQILFHTVCFIIFQDNSVASESVTRPLRTGTVISLPAPAALCE